MRYLSVSNDILGAAGPNNRPSSMEQRERRMAGGSAEAIGARMRAGKWFECPYRRQQVTAKQCATWCANHDAICYRSGTACSMGRVAMERVQ